MEKEVVGERVEYLKEHGVTISHRNRDWEGFGALGIHLGHMGGR